MPSTRILTAFSIAYIMPVMLAMLVFTAGNAPAETIQGRVVGVHDGDSITVLTPDNQQLKVRLEGIDAPELKQDFSQQSKEAMSTLVFGKDITLNVSGKDRYGRTLAVVIAGNVNVNLELVRLGLAWRYDKYSQDAVLLAAQNEAKAARRGLWINPSPVPPWEWRALKKKK